MTAQDTQLPSGTALTRLSLYRRFSLIGTSIVTFFTGRKVGTDSAGNTYFEARRPAKSYYGGTARARRWVMYRTIYDASTVPPEWHGWLHHTQDAPLEANGPYSKNWQKPHQPNLTGGAGAYHPPGSQLAGGQRAKATGDYQAWTPEA